MSLSLAVLEALRDAGCTAAQIVAVIRADRDEQIRRRCARAIAKALFPPPPKMNDQDKNGVIAVTPKMNDQDIYSLIATPTTPAPGSERPGDIGNGTRKTIARAALLRHPRLTPSARRIGEQLVDRYNLETRRCDVSIGRLAGDLGLSTRTVTRAIAQLAASGLIAVVLHGGRAHQNTYTPRWDALRGFASSPDAAKMNEQDILANRTSLSAEQDKNVSETLSLKPESSSRQSPKLRARSVRAAPAQRELALMRVLPGGGNKGDGAYGAAGARLWRQVQGHGTHLDRMRLLDLCQDKALLERATFAEMRDRGSGVAVLLAATGPPAQRTG